MPAADRDKKWLKLYAEHKGKIDADFGKQAFTHAADLRRRTRCDAKFTTTDLAKELKTRALFGPPLGRTWQPTDQEKVDYPEVVPLVPNDWTILHAAEPSKRASAKVADWTDRAEPHRSFAERLPDGLPATRPAWHGTLLPKSDADLWLTEGFAAYERIVAIERVLVADHGELSTDDKDRLAVELNRYAVRRRTYEPTIPASKYDQYADIDRDRLVRAAIGTGVVKLHGLCLEVGTDSFVEWMDEFGRANAGKMVTGGQFHEFVQRKWGKDLNEFAAKWLAEDDKSPRFTVKSWYEAQESTVIVYGTTGDVEANRHTAQQLQYAIARQWSNVKVPIQSDDDALNFGGAAVAQRHVVLVGGPTTNKMANEWRKSFPVSFGKGSFKVRDEEYAHPGSAVIAAGENPRDKSFSAVVIAGLSAEATHLAIPFLLNGSVQPGNVLLIPNLSKARSLVVK